MLKDLDYYTFEELEKKLDLDFDKSNSITKFSSFRLDSRKSI
jgi:hypothetical protein